MPGPITEDAVLAALNTAAPAAPEPPDALFRRLAKKHGLTPTSGTRTPAQNNRAGGATRSQHLTGHALDFGGPPEAMQAFHDEIKRDYPGRYSELIHKRRPKNVRGGSDPDHLRHVHVGYRGVDGDAAEAAVQRAVAGVRALPKVTEGQVLSAIGGPARTVSSEQVLAVLDPNPGMGDLKRADEARLRKSGPPVLPPVNNQGPRLPVPAANPLAGPPAPLPPRPGELRRPTPQEQARIRAQAPPPNALQKVGAFVQPGIEEAGRMLFPGTAAGIQKDLATPDPNRSTAGAAGVAGDVASLSVLRGVVALAAKGGLALAERTFGKAAVEEAARRGLLGSAREGAKTAARDFAVRGMQKAPGTAAVFGAMGAGQKVLEGKPEEVPGAALQGGLAGALGGFVGGGLAPRLPAGLRPIIPGAQGAAQEAATLGTAGAAHQAIEGERDPQELLRTFLGSGLLGGAMGLPGLGIGAALEGRRAVRGGVASDLADSLDAAPAARPPAPRPLRTTAPVPAPVEPNTLPPTLRPQQAAPAPQPGPPRFTEPQQPAARFQTDPNARPLASKPEVPTVEPVPVSKPVTSPAPAAPHVDLRKRGPYPDDSRLHRIQLAREVGELDARLKRLDESIAGPGESGKRDQLETEIEWRIGELQRLKRAAGTLTPTATKPEPPRKVTFGKEITSNKRKEITVWGPGEVGEQRRVTIRETMPKSGKFFIEEVEYTGEHGAMGAKAKTIVHATGLTKEQAKRKAAQLLLPSSGEAVTFTPDTPKTPKQQKKLLPAPQASKIEVPEGELAGVTDAQLHDANRRLSRLAADLTRQADELAERAEIKEPRDVGPITREAEKMRARADEANDHLTRIQSELLTRSKRPAAKPEPAPTPKAAANDPLPEPVPATVPEPAATAAARPAPAPAGRAPDTAGDAPSVRGGERPDGPPVKPQANATGLANQVQERELAVLAPPEKGVTRSAVDAHAEGRRAVAEGQADAESLAREIGKGDRPFTWKEAGVLLEGKRRLLNTVNNTRAALDRGIAEKAADVPRLREEYDAAKARLQEFADNVQKGKTEWHNTGMALQAGTTLDEGNFAEVLAEARRRKGADLDPKQEARLKDLTEQVRGRDEQIVALEKELKRLEAEATVRAESPAAKGERRTPRISREAVRKEREAIFKEIDEIISGAAGRVSDVSAVAYDAARFSYAAGKLAVNYMKEGVAVLDEVVAKVQADLKARGIEATYEQVIDDIAEVSKGKRQSPTAIQQQISRLKSEARRDADLRRQIENLKQGLPNRPPAQRKQMSERIAELERQRDELTGTLEGKDLQAQQRVRTQISRLKAGEPLRLPGKPAEASPALQALRTERDKLVKERRDRARISELNRQIAALEKGETLSAGVKPKPGNPAVAALRGKRDELARARAAQAQIAELERRLREGDYHLEPRKTRAASRQLEDLRAQRDLLKRQVQAHIDAAKPKTVLQRAGEVTGNVRRMILGGDLGTLTRQGLFAWSHPITAARAVGTGARAAFSETAMAKWEMELRERTINGKSAAVERKRAGLQITDTIVRPEELVVARLLKRIPVAGPVAAGLERGQTTFINAVRAELFDQALREGMNPHELRLRASFINASTGRGNVQRVPELLKVLMTSPRYEASRWEILWQPFKNSGALAAGLAKGEGVNRAAAANLKDMAMTTAGLLALFKTAELAGYEVEWDPLQSDFGKMRKGDEVWDVSAGIAPRLRDVARVVVATLNPDYRKNLFQVAGKAALRTVSPGIRTPIEQGSIALQRARGNTEPASPFQGFKSREDREGLITLAPLIAQSVRETLGWEGDPETPRGPGGAAWTGGRELIGQGVNRYPKPEPW